MSAPSGSILDLGIGVGLRVPHYAAILEGRPAVDFFEVISENFMVAGGKPLYHLDAVRESYRVVQHGVSLGIGSPDPPDRDYLAKLRALVRRLEPPWLSDHLAWCGAGGAHLHDLLPLPHSTEVVALVAERARMIQDYLEVPFALENTSSYLRFSADTMPEWQFVSEVVERADVKLLFDVNNVYVNAYNHGDDPHAFVRNVPHERIVQIHLAGHTNFGTHVIDTHSGPPIDAVWELYEETIRLAGPISTLVEWDEAIPPLDVVLGVAETARAVRNRVIRGADEPKRLVPATLVEAVDE